MKHIEFTHQQSGSVCVTFGNLVNSLVAELLYHFHVATLYVDVYVVCRSVWSVSAIHTYVRVNYSHVCVHSI